MDQEPQKNSNTSLSQSWRQRLNTPRGLLALAVVAVLMLGAAAYLAARDDGKDKSPATASPVQPSANVSLTKDGLTPATITIAVGTQVAWTNTDDAPHQVAADPHPRHDSIEGFDSDVTLQKGEVFSFTFETAGTYTYHDHLNPLDKRWQGTVIVE